MKYIFYFLLFLLLSQNACQNDNERPQNAHAQQQSTSPPLRCSLKADPLWKYGGVQLYPILADSAVAARQSDLKNWKVLAEVMPDRRFRITEMKQFGSERAWYNGLTVQNRSRDTVLLLSGDVVQGGNQDRTIAMEQIVPPATVRNIEVFCVEHGRSTYYNENASESEKQLAAFRGYYNVASPSVRRAVQNGDQQGVWSAVSQVTAGNNATSPTQTYAALDNGAAEQQERTLLLERFEALSRKYPDLTGMIAVHNGEIIGVDVFGHPALFAKCAKALLHGYVSDAMQRTPQHDTTVEALPALQHTLNEVAALATGTKADSHAQVEVFQAASHWVHIYKK